MPFTVEDFRDLIQVLERHPEWQEELRRRVLTDELLDLPRLMRDLAAQVQALAEAQQHTEERVEELAAAQRRTEERVEELAAAQRRTEERVEELAEAQRRTEKRVEELAEAQQRTEERVEELTAAQRRTEERVEELAAAQRRTEERVEELAAAQRRIEERVEELAAAQRRTEERVEELAAAQRRTEERVEELAAAQRRTEEGLQSLTQTVEALIRRVDRMDHDIGDLKEDALERRYWERAPAYFGGPHFRKVHALSSQELADLLDQAVEQGLLTWEERQKVLLADVVVRGRRKDGEETYLVVEVSWGVGMRDVTRAVERVEILGKVVAHALPAVAGRGISPEAREAAENQQVIVVFDGHAIWPYELR